MEENDVIRALSALAHASRLQLFRALVVAGPEGMTPSVMAEGSRIAPPTLSFHLKELMNAGLVTQERRGRHLVYRASFERMNGVLGYLTANCCEGASCLDEAVSSCSC